MITKIDQAALGSQNRNYIANPGAEIGAVNWQKFTTTLTSGVPTGAPSLGSGNYTLNLTLTNPLRGVFGLTLSGGATTVAGTGIISSAFTLDNADLAQVLTAVFEYQVTSGASFLTFSGTSTQTLEVWLYDVTAAAWLQPAGFRGLNQLTGAGKLAATFQSSITSGQQYRLAIIQTQTVSGTYVMQADGFRVGPQVVQYGSPVTDWQSYTPTINWTAGVGFGVYGRYRRVGDSLHAQVYIPISGPVTAAQLYVSIPTGFTIDSTKLAGPIGFNQTNPNGTWTAIRTGVAIYNGVVAAITSTQVWLTVNGNGNVLTNTIPATWANNDYISCEFFVPVTGWSSTVQMSNDTDTRVVAALATKSGTQVLSATTTTVTGWAISADTHGAMSTTGTYTVSVTGWYEIGQFFTLTGASGLYGNLVNISGAGLNFFGNYVTSDRVQSSTLRYLTAGSTIVPGIYSSTSSGTISAGEWWVKRVSGPATIAANEAVAMRAYKTSGSHTNNGNNQTVASYNASPFDTHGAFNITTGEYTVPVSGTYLVAGTIGFSPNATGVRALQIEVDLSRKLGGEVRTADGSNVNTLNFSGLVTAIAGQKITVSTFQNSGGNLNYDTTSNYNSLSIVRVGN